MIRVPETATAERDKLIHDSVINPRIRVPVEWSGLQCSCTGHTGILYVASDDVMIRATWNSTETCDCGMHQGVLYIPETDEEIAAAGAVRVDVTPTSAQQICDCLGTLLPTTKILDMTYEQKVIELPPYTSTADAHMADTSRMVWHSQKIDTGKAGRTGLICNVGKHWMFTNTLLQHPGKSANYGWYDPSAPNLSATNKYKMWQCLSWAHNLLHVDYSQILLVIGSEMIVDGHPVSTWEVLKDPDRCAMISYEGPLTIDRIPGVEPDPDSGCDLISPVSGGEEDDSEDSCRGKLRPRTRP